MKKSSPRPKRFGWTNVLKFTACQPLRSVPRRARAALRFVRGAHAVIYDAEDRPDRHQLKKVVAAFRRAWRAIACFQARLNVYNAGDNLLTWMFALEYANHFRTEILRDVMAGTHST